MTLIQQHTYMVGLLCDPLAEITHGETTTPPSTCCQQHTDAARPGPRPDNLKEHMPVCLFLQRWWLPLSTQTHERHPTRPC
jgi:hypothetical protein